MVEHHNARAGFGIVFEDWEKARLDTGNGGEDRPQEIGFGRVDGDRRNAARRRWDRGASGW